MVKAAPELLARFEDLVDVVADADRKLVFGCPACLVRGHMFFGCHSNGLFVRLPPELGTELLAEGGSVFSPMPGRAMNGFWILPASGELEYWVRRAHDFAASLPAKKGKA